jgi:hypothetical protein
LAASVSFSSSASVRARDASCLSQGGALSEHHDLAQCAAPRRERLSLGEQGQHRERALQALLLGPRGARLFVEFCAIGFERLERVLLVLPRLGRLRHVAHVLLPRQKITQRLVERP